MIDDSELFHGTYDPDKARAYYLRTRKLKGRRPSTATVISPGKGGRRPSGGSGGKPNRADTKSRQAELKAQKEALKKRLDRLREVLSELVDAAQKRGDDANKSNDKKEPKDAAPETQIDKADRNKAEKAAKPLSSKQKADKAKQAKEAYEKENPNSLSTDVDILKSQVQDIQKKIQQAVAASRDRRNKAGTQAELVQPNANKPNDGPRGR